VTVRTRRLLFVRLPTAVALAAAAAAFLYARVHDARGIRAGFAVEAGSLNDDLGRELNAYLESLRSLGYLYDSSKAVDRGEFRTFTEGPLARHKAFVALMWQPRAPGAGLPERFQNAFIEPTTAEAPALGFDPAAAPAWAQAYERARDTGEPAATGLARSPFEDARQPHFLLVNPIYTHGPRPASVPERRRRLRGFVTGAVALERIVDASLARRSASGLSVAIENLDAPADVRRLYPPTPPAAPPALTVPLRMGLPGLAWDARYGLTAAELDGRRSNAPWAVLAGGLAAAGGLTAFMTLLASQTDTIEKEVLERTVEIERQKGLLRSIIDNMGEGVVVADARGKFLVFNAAAERIIGIGATDSGPQEWSDRYGVFRPDGATPLPPEQNPLARALRGEAADDEELFVRNPHIPDGVYLSVTARPLKSPDGAPAGGVAVFRDISARRRTADELRRAKAAAEAAAEAKAAFLANMSHEIRTPMNAVVGMAGLLQGSPLSAEQREYVTTLRSAADGLLTIVNDILDFSRYEAGRIPLERADFDLPAAVRDTLRILGPAAEAKGLALTFACDPSVPARLRGDAGRLRQVLLNLVGNSVKFTAEGGVALEARREGSGTPVKVVFTVKDTGIGIPVAAQAALFAPFTQAEASTTRRFGGTGLGLAICKKIIAAMGGDISLKSRPGEGAEFRFHVLLEPASEDASAAGPGAQEAAGFGRLKVLLVDDNPTNIKVASLQLGKLGVTPDTASDGAQALAALGAARYDVVFLDCHMPVMDGFATVRELRASEGTGRRTPVVAMTANALEGDRETCLAAGMDDYLAKPVGLEDLAAALARWAPKA
jgi:PAS domain S-box-containing protein